MYLSFGSASLENPDSDNRVQGFGEDVQDGWAPGWVDRECKFYFSRYRGQQAQLDITRLHQICHLCPVGNWYLRWPRAVRIWHWKVPQGGSKATLSNGSGSQQYSFTHSSLPFFPLSQAKRHWKIFTLKVCPFRNIKIQIWHLPAQSSEYGFLLILSPLPGPVLADEPPGCLFSSFTLLSY